MRCERCGLEHDGQPGDFSCKAAGWSSCEAITASGFRCKKRSLIPQYIHPYSEGDFEFDYFCGTHRKMAHGGKHVRRFSRERASAQLH